MRVGRSETAQRHGRVELSATQAASNIVPANLAIYMAVHTIVHIYRKPNVIELDDIFLTSVW